MFLFDRSIVTCFLLLSFLSTLNTTYTGAGILPYAYSNKTKKYYFLLGKEAYGKNVKNRWADFGGRIEPADHGSSEHNAIREFYAETGYPEKARPWLLKQIKKNLHIKHPYHNYYMYLAQIPYRQAATLKGDGEKSEFAWIPAAFFIKSLGRTLSEKGKIPDCFIYKKKIYVLRKDFQECLGELLKQYDPNQEHYYFQARNPKEIIARIRKTQSTQ
jgi:8-oxo-dGTP pyrophosphatase MutT (NUDIX family)